MKLRITVRVSADRDPSCNTYTCARSVYLEGSEMPHALLLKSNLPIFLPTDVEVVELDGGFTGEFPSCRSLRPAISETGILAIGSVCPHCGHVEPPEGED